MMSKCNDTISRQTVMSELKPCPFCGNEVKVEKIPLWYGNGRGYSGCYEFKIKCESCGCSVDQPENDSVYRSEEKARENAVEAWNRRAEMQLSSAQPPNCEGCKHLGKWENEVEYGYPSPCTRCKRRVEDHYER